MNVEPVILFQPQTEFVKVSIEAYFDGANLVIDGYDMGKRVEELWHREDYEYKLTIPPESVLWMMAHFNVQTNQSLLQTLASTFNTNSCYSDIRKLLDDNQQPCIGFSW